MSALTLYSPKTGAATDMMHSFFDFAALAGLEQALSSEQRRAPLPLSLPPNSYAVEI